MMQQFNKSVWYEKYKCIKVDVDYTIIDTG